MTADELVERLLALWDDVPATDDQAVAAFAALYADPVRINGVEMALDQLVERARRTAAALAGRRTEVLSVVEGGDCTAVAFRLHGRHIGPLDTPLGPAPGTGAEVTVQVIDVLTVEGGRITEIWMVADYLGLLASEGAVRLIGS
jgi:predicted ester cyclase